MLNQAYIFIIFVLNGLIIGILFDIFRVLRKSFKTADNITYLEDFLFWIIAGFILLYSIFKFNNGELRLYIFFGVILGVILYLLGFSKIFITLSTKIVLFVKKCIKNIIIKPLLYVIKSLKKLLMKPITFIFINFKKFFKKIHFYSKKSKLKKDSL